MKTKFRENIRLLIALLLAATVIGIFGAAWFGCSEQPGTGYEAPSRIHWLGCRGSGADLAHYTAEAVLRTVSLAVFLSAVVVCLGFLVGGTWAICGDRSLSGCLLQTGVLGLLGPTPIVLSIGILFAFRNPGSFSAVAMALTLGALGNVTLLMRQEVRGLLKRPWVKFARAEGSGIWNTLWHEVFPSAQPIIYSLAILTCITLVATETVLGSLCAGTSTPSLGRLLEDARQAYGVGRDAAAWRFIAASGVSLGLIIGSFTLLHGWFEDRRVLRGSLAAADGGITGDSPGWGITVRHRSTGRLQACGHVQFIPGVVHEFKGESGSGKSLLMQAVCGVLSDDLVGEVVPVGIPPDIAMLYVPQAMQESFAGSMKSYCDAFGVGNENFKEIAKKLDLNDDVLTRKQAEKIAGGEAARLQLVFALAAMPTNRQVALFVDEPVASVDEENLARVGKVLMDAARLQNISVVVANHRPGFQRFVQRSTFIDRGRPIWSGTVAALTQESDLPAPVRNYCNAVRQLQIEAPRTTTQNTPKIQVQNLTLGYTDGTQLVNAFSFTVHAGEIVCVVGKSGTGKSTLLTALDGRLAPQMGEILIKTKYGQGRPRTPDNRAWREVVRVAWQNPRNTLNPDVAVGRALARAARLLNIDDHSVAEAVLRACGRASFPERKLHLHSRALSGGLRARAGLARAFLGSPEILLLDEPTAGLDVEVALVVLDQIREFAASGGTVVIVDHDPKHVAYLGARSVYLS